MWYNWCMKNKQKGFVTPVVFSLIFILVIVIVFLYINKKTAVSPSVGDDNVPALDQNNMVGNDKDSHGCIGSAGYAWCEIKSKCLRVWEEKCEIGVTGTTSTINTTDIGTSTTVEVSSKKVEVTCSLLGQPTKDSTEPGPPMADLNSCCAGLTPTYPLQDFDKSCVNTYLERGPSGPTNYLCLACGDGICDSKYENKCNCSGDCK